MGFFCKFGEGDCGENLGWGICTAWAQPCDLTFIPVCGCDDMTYANECNAKAAGIDVAHDGPC
jgi:hypothetical protein